MTLSLRGPLFGFAFALAATTTLAQTASELCRLPTPPEVARFTDPVQSPGIVSPIDGTCWLPAVTITSFDGTKLAANLFLPRRTRATQKFPTVLMIGSFGAPGRIEYVGQQQRLAKDGYVVASYTARGFYLSEGVIGGAGPQDVRDVSSVIDWLLANAPVDVDNIAASGISYGAGLSMLAMARDPRIKTAAALSGWGSMADELYPRGTYNLTWGSLLTLGGKVTGRLSPEWQQNTLALMNPDTPQSKIDEILEGFKPSSPSSHVDALNARNAPVFISHNFQDDLFTPNSTLAMFAALTGPKKMVLNPGVHASAEGAGAVLGADNYPYDQAHRWFDRWLKGIANGIDTEPQVTMQIKFSGQRESFATWPAPELRDQTYYLGPRGLPRFDPTCLCGKGDKGSISSSPNGTPGSDLIQNFSDTTATSGPLPILSTFGESVNVPVVNSLPSVALASGIRFEAPALQSAQKIRGIARLKLRVTPTQARAQVAAYLYDVDAVGTGVLITHGASTLHWATPGRTLDLPLDFAATAYDVPAGHHIGVVIDTADSLYASPVHPGERFGLRFEFDPARQATLVLPTR
ncbi:MULTISPECIES: CocE/NonD family hydrolase [unclassified Variovorax]|uniref:CocE/NonD family hydrolase n=1 Tax=unclassified Variovorax TaxID=663243 RepID=UPI002575099D|nr:MULTISPECIES: CocE/NonD family hydrolase [unclassified Variovorax]MDM0088598.1 CocE/NonD family hydrolase [Variovorax sp. J22G40]MDM0146671.1 CocE/NonD family hydrolase [Variovorax sp. J2P1-31]